MNWATLLKTEAESAYTITERVDDSMLAWKPKQHKGQLFYYLKLQGVPVSTPDLWGE